MLKIEMKLFRPDLTYRPDERKSSKLLSIPKYGRFSRNSSSKTSKTLVEMTSTKITLTVE